MPVPSPTDCRMYTTCGDQRIYGTCSSGGKYRIHKQMDQTGKSEGFECGIGLEKYNDIKEGDIIAYGLSGGVSVLHRVVETDKNSRIWRTKGDANEVSDPGAVSYEQYLGKMIFSLPYVGYLISVFKRRSIWLGTIAVGILLIILQQKETWKSGKEKTV